MVRSSASGRARMRMRWQANTPTVFWPIWIGRAMKDTGPAGSLLRSTMRPRKIGSLSMSCTMVTWPCASTLPVTPSLKA
ncbi:hypothetical protein D3C78_1004640 [compost metagenome]